MPGYVSGTGMATAVASAGAGALPAEVDAVVDVEVGPVEVAVVERRGDERRRAGGRREPVLEAPRVPGRRRRARSRSGPVGGSTTSPSYHASHCRATGSTADATGEPRRHGPQLAIGGPARSEGRGQRVAVDGAAGEQDGGLGADGVGPSIGDGAEEQGEALAHTPGPRSAARRRSACARTGRPSRRPGGGAARAGRAPARPRRAARAAMSAGDQSTAGASPAR